MLVHVHMCMQACTHVCSCIHVWVHVHPLYAGGVCPCVQPAAATRGRAGLLLGAGWGLEWPGWVLEAGGNAVGAPAGLSVSAWSQSTGRGSGSSARHLVQKAYFLDLVPVTIFFPQAPAGMGVGWQDLCASPGGWVSPGASAHGCPVLARPTVTQGVGPAWSVWKTLAQALLPCPHVQQQVQGAGYVRLVSEPAALSSTAQCPPATQWSRSEFIKTGLGLFQVQEEGRNRKKPSPGASLPPPAQHLNFAEYPSVMQLRLALEKH